MSRNVSNMRMDWFTPISQSRTVEFALLETSNDLILRVYVWQEDFQGQTSFYKFSWPSWIVYKITDETYPAFSHCNVDPEIERYSSEWSAYVQNSSWVEEVLKCHLVPQATKHYLLFMETNAIHVLSAVEPEILKVDDTQVAFKDLRKQSVVIVKYKYPGHEQS